MLDNESEVTEDEMYKIPDELKQSQGQEEFLKLQADSAVKLTRIYNHEDFNEICSSSNYIGHYIARHSDFSSQVIVVLWKEGIPGPSIIHDGFPVIYVHHASPVEDFSAWNKMEQNSPNPNQKGDEYSAEQLQRATEMKSVIAKYFRSLFDNHSNLVSIRPSDQQDGIVFIEFVVLAKNFLPIIDKAPLPRELDGIPTRVSSGWVELCGLQEQIYQRPLRPGAGFAVGMNAEIDLENASEGDYNPPSMGTMGGLNITKDGQTYGVTCGHCLRIKNNSNKLHPKGSLTYQPCAMGMLVSAVNRCDGLMGDYGTMIESKGHLQSTKWLIGQLHDNDAEFDAQLQLPCDAQCGQIHGGMIGPLHKDSSSDVDVGLIKLSVSTAGKCARSRLGEESPDLLFDEREGEEATTCKILNPDRFPRRDFFVYGRGARSSNSMKGIVNPLQADIYLKALDHVFHCILAKVTVNWSPGDSGAWCWTDEGTLVGMGMAVEHIGTEHYCCLLPMEDVVSSVQQLLHNTVDEEKEDGGKDG